MKNPIGLNVLVLFLFLGSLAPGVVRAEGGTKQEFIYEQKKLSQIKEKARKYKVAIGTFGEGVDVEGSPFNKEEEPAEAGQTYNVNISSSNLETPSEERIDVVAGLLSGLLRETGMFNVIERQDVNQLIREIEFEKSEWAQKEKGNELGNIYGVQYILLGDVLPNRGGEEFGPGQYTTSLRLVDVNTGVAVSTGIGQKNYLQDALSEAVDRLAEDMQGEPWVCRVVRIDNDGVYINAGFDDDIEKNDVFGVVRLGEPIKEGGNILGYKRIEIAKVKVAEVLEKNLSLVRPFDVTQEIKVGDLVSAKRVTPPDEKEMNKWNEIFGKNTTGKTGEVSSFSLPASSAKKSLPVSSVEEIVDAYGKSIVLIQTDKGTGSGFVVSPDGLIVTNSHVVNGAGAISVKFIADNRAYSGVQVVRDNTARDLALLRVNGGDNFVPVVLGDSNRVSVGQRVVAIGNPLGVLENTVSDGLVSAIRDSDGTKLLQISVPISHGSSGGALFNMDGEVIGVPSSGLEEGQNLNFAVAINHVKDELLP